MSNALELKRYDQNLQAPVNVERVQDGPCIKDLRSGICMPRKTWKIIVLGLPKFGIQAIKI
jgi:hypothetical protein